MPALPPPARLKALIEDAMKQRAPQMYRELRECGRLAKVLEDRAEQAQTSYQDGLSMMLEAQGETHQEMVNAATQARNEAARVALDQAIEFQESPPTEALHESKSAANGSNPGGRAGRPGF